MKKVSVLIAAGSGMGADAAKTLAKDGFKVAIMSSSGKGERLAKKLNGMVMPTLILVDKGGMIKWRHQGYIPGEEFEIQKQIENLLVAN